MDRPEVRSTPIRVRLTPSERKLVQDAARVNQQNVSQFLRDALMTAAGDCLESVPIIQIRPRS